MPNLELRLKDIFRQVDERAREAGSVILIAEIYHSKNEDEKVLLLGQSIELCIDDVLLQTS